jgi:hypothetical protein
MARELLLTVFGLMDNVDRDVAGGLAQEVISKKKLQIWIPSLTEKSTRQA